MAHLQYMPGDPRLVDQLVYELKSKGIFDQFRKECIADVDTRPAYQNLRQRVESSVTTFLARQCWKPDLNKNQLREKLRKHILDGNYLEQGVERIVDQVVNPKVASVFIPQVEDLVYNYLGITRKKTVPAAETSNDKVNPDALLPTDLEAVSPGSVKSNNDDKNEAMDTEETKEETKMEVYQEEPKDVKEKEVKEDTIVIEPGKKENEGQDNRLSGIREIASNDSISSNDKSSIPLPAEEIKLESIPAPDNSPPKVELEKIKLPKEPNLSTDIPLPDEIPKMEKDTYFKPINSEDDESSSDSSSLRRNMSPLTPIRNFNNENSCDAQQAFENDSETKHDEKKEPSTFRFTIESQKVEKSTENSSDGVRTEKKELEVDLSYKFSSQVNINNFNTPLYDDSSNSNNLQIDYESDFNSKTNNVDNKLPEAENSEDSKKERKTEEKKSSQNSSHRSRDSYRHSSSKDKRSDSKHSTSRDSSRHDKKSSSSKDDSKSKSNNKERDQSRDKSEKKDGRDSSKHRSSHKSSSHKDSRSHRSSSSSQRHSSKHSDDKKSSSSKDKNEKIEKSLDKSSKEKSKDSRSSSRRSDKDKDRKSSSKKSEEKDKKKDKKDTDDHYSLSGRGNQTRRSTDRDSNDGSSSSKGSHNQSSQKQKSTDNKKDSKGNSSKSENTSTSGESASPCDKEHVMNEKHNVDNTLVQGRPSIVRIDNHLEVPVATPPRLPFVPDVTLKKPKFAANLQEAKRLMKMRKFLDEEQKRMNQEAALLLEFQANVRPSLSQVYSSIPGPELEFACVTNPIATKQAPYEVTIQHVENLNPVTEVVQQAVDTNQANETQRIEHKNLIAEELANMSNAADVAQTPLEFENTLQINNDVLETSTVVQLVPHKDEDNEEINTTIPEIANVTNIQDKFCNEMTIEMLKRYETVEKSSEMNNKATNMKSEKNNQEKGITYNENKPFSQLMEEISEYSKASENKMKGDSQSYMDISEDQNKHTEYFEVTIITEEVSGTEDTDTMKHNRKSQIVEEIINSNNELKYFAEHEKYDAEIERDKFAKFFKAFMETTSVSNKMFLFNCDTYEENILKEVSLNMGEYEIVNYYKNGYLKVPKTAKNIVKNVNLAEEITLPLDNTDFESKSVFSPVKSECSFELSSDYDAKLEEMVNKTSRQEVMEIILGGVLDESPSKMPKIDYCTESNIESDTEKPLKRKLDEVETTVNNNRHILTSNKIRKLSDSDQITSTTEETEETSSIKPPNNTRSKYLGRAKRVGLPRPKKSNLPNSPSSDKSVENYEQSPATPTTPNGKLKPTQRSKVQRYDLTDLYKPKLHYLSRRNNIS